MSLGIRSLALALLIALAGCVNTTTFISTWKAPDAQAINPSGKTVAAIFVTRNESQRRAGEDALAADITAHGAHGVPGYMLLPNEGPGDGEAVREQLKAAGANGAVVMRVVGKNQRVTYTPGYAAVAPLSPYYYGFGPYWGYGWGAVYEPGYLQTDTLVSVETLVYSLERDKLLWASTSRTTNPQNLDTLINEVASATAKEMVDEGVLAQ
jgi:hypothetical protein